MDWTSPIDAYCERTDPSFWAEPVNAVTNAAFLIAPFLAYALASRRAGSVVGWAELALSAIVFVIGIGSFLFHTVATRWAALADVLPIAVFIFSYFAYALSRFVGLGWIGTLLATILFLAASQLAEPAFAWAVGSSAGYMPGLLAMLGIGGFLVSRAHPAGRAVLGAGAVFTLSLAFRIADGPVCDHWALGTHFLWHILNATTLGLLLYAAMRHGHGHGHGHGGNRADSRFGT
ncbi:hypothetical protein DYI37_14835 [Fulvimarina endophytica]|uniref:Ceramidase n=1 Tax=Fulvimarina endophytica TaxID=2293836 RepID=A0A371WZY4_9HYPH|nr:ceramidase domain-containing protein [Fulvimarina endophytica]RFC62529.1 hypothetical protein DYI37_14835 [Fulvimarina endophytica]